MERAVMISIRPEWVQKILGGKKTLEVRKSHPKLETPFKCYIYCTKDAKDPDRLWVLRKKIRQEHDGLAAVCANFDGQPPDCSIGNGKVVAEFTCDVILPIQIECSSPAALEAGIEVPGTCLTDREILEYLGNGKQGFCWHISNLQIYDTPKPINSFTCIREGIDGMGWWPMYRAPQSWGYVITEGDDADEPRRNA